jgi:glucokinase
MANLGIDIGASKVYYVALEGNERSSEGHFDLTPQTTDTVLEVCKKISSELQEKSIQIEKIGVGVPGLPKNGTLSYAPNFTTLVGFPLAQEVGKILDSVPVVVHNDANAFTYAEVSLGTASEFQNVVGLTLGTGLGGGLVINGQLYIGKGGAEIGHTILNLRENEEAEDLVSSKFFKNRGKDPVEVREKAETGDQEAKALWEELGKNLGYLTANIVNILDPQAVVIGGGMADAYELFIDATKEVAAAHIVGPESKNVPLLKSALGPAGGAIGCALLAG